MKIYIKSCHASLEFDEALMFLRMGHHVAGSFDTGSEQRPKIKGVTDVSYDLEAGIAGSDLILLHQVENFPVVLEEIAIAFQPKPVILHVFGQGCMDQHVRVVKVVRSRTNAYVVAYSLTDYTRYLSLGMSRARIRMIRFAKDLEEYDTPWTGRLPICYMTCNSIIKRGEGCGLSLSRELMEMDVPLLITGKETHEVPWGIDALTYEGMKNLYTNVRCYFAIGTQPAPYTLTPVEAMCSGTPVIAYDNGSGIRDEGLPVMLVKDAGEVEATIRMLVNDLSYARHMSRIVRKFAVENFCMEKIAVQWDEFMETMI